MGKTKSPRHHETSYTNGEKILSIARQLFLLREALPRTVSHPTYYPELFRALRVLVADGHRGRLGEMAEKLKVTHTLPSILSEKPMDSDPSGKRHDNYKEMRSGCVGMFFLNQCSRWFTLLNIDIDQTEPSRETDFWTYLEEENVLNKSEYAARVSRKMLIEEVNNTKDVVHSSDHYATFLQGAQALGKTGPYFLELAQEVAYEALIFGRNVVEKGAKQYKAQIAIASKYAIEVPASACGRCGNLVEVDQFDCPSCKSRLLPEARIYSIPERLTSMWHHCKIVNTREGTMVQGLPASTIRQQPAREFILARAEDNLNEMKLRRTADLKLAWSFTNEDGCREALFDLDELPGSGLVTIFLRWDRNKIAIVAPIKNGALVEVDHYGERKYISQDKNNE